MALSFQNELGASSIWSHIEDVKEILKNKLLEAPNIGRCDSVDSNFNYDCFENDVFPEEGLALTYPNKNNLQKILNELAVFLTF